MDIKRGPYPKPCIYCGTPTWRMVNGEYTCTACASKEKADADNENKPGEDDKPSHTPHKTGRSKSKRAGR